jgi:hypothetical protein
LLLKPELTINAGIEMKSEGTESASVEAATQL